MVICLTCSLLQINIIVTQSGAHMSMHAFSLDIGHNEQRIGKGSAQLITRKPSLWSIDMTMMVVVVVQSVIDKPMLH